MSDMTDMTDLNRPQPADVSRDSGVGLDDASPYRLQMTGPDGETAWYVTTAYAGEQLRDYVQGQQIVQQSCRRYTRRILEEQRAGGAVDYTPAPTELACLRLGSGRHAIYWVKEASLAARFKNTRNAQGHLARPGRPAGSRNLAHS